MEGKAELSNTLDDKRGGSGTETRNIEKREGEAEIGDATDRITEDELGEKVSNAQRVNARGMFCIPAVIFRASSERQRERERERDRERFSPQETIEVGKNKERGKVAFCAEVAGCGTRHSSIMYVICEKKSRGSFLLFYLYG